ncbi:MAG TPA: hypothetical protein VHB73_08280, partial [Alphaproteobacteria bacterium]|nr:hypothetical protein [Alphaproteobacteria bacterium]
MSFACVYVLNLQGEANRDALARLVNPIVQSVVDDPSLIDDKLPAAPVTEAARRAVFSHEEERDGTIRRTLAIGPGETLSSRLIAAGITRTETAKSLDAMRGMLNPRRLAAGQKVVVLFRKNADGQENYSGFELRKDNTQLVSVARMSEDGFKSQLSTVVPQKHRFALRAVVQDGVYQSGLKVGVPAAVLNTMIKNYSYL